MRKIDLAYMAGIFDGEGSLSITKSKRLKCWNASYNVRASVQMCNAYIPNLFRMAFGGAICYQPPNGTHRATWRWHLETRNIIAFLEALLPYLHLKRDEAELAIQFQMQKKTKRTSQGNPYTSAEIAIFEAERLLMHNLHDKSVQDYAARGVGVSGNHIPLNIK